MGVGPTRASTRALREKASAGVRTSPRKAPRGGSGQPGATPSPQSPKTGAAAGSPNSTVGGQRTRGPGRAAAAPAAQSAGGAASACPRGGRKSVSPPGSVGSREVSPPRDSSRGGPSAFAELGASLAESPRGDPQPKADDSGRGPGSAGHSPPGADREVKSTAPPTAVDTAGRARGELPQRLSPTRDEGRADRVKPPRRGEVNGNSPARGSRYNDPDDPVYGGRSWKAPTSVGSRAVRRVTPTTPRSLFQPAPQAAARGAAPSANPYAQHRSASALGGGEVYVPYGTRVALPAGASRDDPYGRAFAVPSAHGVPAQQLPSSARADCGSAATGRYAEAQVGFLTGGGYREAPRAAPSADPRWSAAITEYPEVPRGRSRVWDQATGGTRFGSRVRSQSRGPAVWGISGASFRLARAEPTGVTPRSRRGRPSYPRGYRCPWRTCLFDTPAPGRSSLNR